MKKIAFLLLFLAFQALLAEEENEPTTQFFSDENNSYAEENLSDEKKFYVTPKIGFGIDFDGRPGFPDTMELKNKFGFSIGLDLDGIVYRNNDGKLMLGFGVGFQYWVPTSAQEYESSYKDYDEDSFYIGPCKNNTCEIRMHYMRLPFMFNFSYEFNIKTDILTAFAPKLSLGFNNNIFVFDLEDFKEAQENQLKDMLGKYKCSFAWGVGFNFVFKERYLVIATIGGDVGKDDVEYWYKSPKSENTLYGHHEFFTMEFGFRM